MTRLSVGHARERITPPVGTHMMGYAARHDPSIGVHDDLWGDAAALTDGETTALILALDLAALDPPEVREIKRTIASRTALPAENILINCSHTHAGPVVCRRPGLIHETQYVAELMERCAQAAVAAVADLAPATLSVGAAALDIGCNRRQRDGEHRIVLGPNPKGPRLAEVDVWYFAREERGDIVLFSTPVHGTTLGPENLLLSSEWMGAAVRGIEAASSNVAAVFLQGCAGNQNPYRYLRSFAQVEELGQRTAAAVSEAMRHARPIVSTPLRNRYRDIALPLEGGGTHPCPIHGLRLGDAVLVGLGGEAFVEYALHGRERSRAASTLILGYTDGSVQYLPTDAAYHEGGYEPGAYKYFPVGKSWKADAIETRLKDAIEAMLAELAGEVSRPPYSDPAR